MNGLLAVDLQNDFFCGSLAIPRSEEIIPLVNQTLDYFSIIAASQDWHPYNHKSFASQHKQKKIGDKVKLAGVEQTLWPDHCVAESEGAKFHPDIRVEKIDKFFYKGNLEDVDSYSAFYDRKKNSTGLSEWLKEKKVQKLFVLGLATDYCVRFSVLDALKDGFDVFVLKDLCRAVNLKAGDEEKALTEMEEKGATIIQSTQLKEYFV